MAALGLLSFGCGPRPTMVNLLAAHKEKRQLLDVNSYEQPFSQGRHMDEAPTDRRHPAFGHENPPGAASYEHDGMIWVDDIRLATDRNR